MISEVVPFERAVNSTAQTMAMAASIGGPAGALTFDDLQQRLVTSYGLTDPDDARLVFTAAVLRLELEEAGVWRALEWDPRTVRPEGVVSGEVTLPWSY